ncbi:hypothetical protein ABB37_04228 [Leptomonas pyrrhocoris]|uniref:Uncharacterized protein n=1 Tax=Leptomonas pyrrhocoris TaxID=157538 RepID=A0A0N0DVY0_LEPPY|nr:hypothetical protein ABB37_04228 [Leptomonas pyrrhocoris]KPA80781.1 hypothetical protein ABB37_04228 [Leptomonas pyrrhocoris]|eukprot:XP_015659220.1 hypothetical protein ABB37_04228 [Leptomonas pyrrhocoris]
MTDAVDDDVRLMSRDERVASYRELVEGLEGILASHDPDGAGGEDDNEDAEQLALVEEVETQLRTLAKLLNDEETIQVTPGLIKKVSKSAVIGGAPETTILYPPPPPPSSSSSINSSGGGAASGAGLGSSVDPTASAPYEVLFDEREWYPCVITGLVPPENEVDRVQYKAWILGHNVEEAVYSEALRPWQPSPTAAEELQSGTGCHVIHPRTGRYVPGVVDRLTLERTVFVKVPAGEQEKWAEVSATTAAAAAAASPSETVLVPLSHVRTGKFYAQLRHRPKNDEERAARRAEQMKLKRQRVAQERQNTAEKIAKEANDWQALMGDMMGLDSGGSSAKKKRRLK